MRRTTYRIELRLTLHGENATSWQPQTRVKTRPEAERLKDMWAARGFEVQIVVEK